MPFLLMPTLFECIISFLTHSKDTFTLIHRNETWAARASVESPKINVLDRKHTCSAITQALQATHLTLFWAVR